MNRHTKNKLSTPSYFVKRLKDNGFITFKIFKNYSQGDPRRWTILVDPGVASIYVTCYENKAFEGDVLFEFSDGGQLLPKNFSIKTNSIEVIVTKLLQLGIQQVESTGR